MLLHFDGYFVLDCVLHGKLWQRVRERATGQRKRTRARARETETREKDRERKRERVANKDVEYIFYLQLSLALRVTATPKIIRSHSQLLLNMKDKPNHPTTQGVERIFYLQLSLALLVTHVEDNFALGALLVLDDFKMARRRLRQLVANALYGLQ